MVKAMSEPSSNVQDRSEGRKQGQTSREVTVSYTRGDKVDPEGRVGLVFG